ncbi:DUF3942 family protein [Bacillus thuringiensis]|uniref:DUF3942 domain-containing protein n=1 Tax=Bacillus thuringiensis TaxID=1428 RepID=A0A9X6Q8F7_BACTU|nr:MULTISPECIES: DUF3942 family protein [Bacillus cereus group]MEB8657174.1 DUF3942 family protein [Bacillus cereus]MDR5045580.1 DUF3942 domain-containing protein [Bacillus thuringiensis]MEB8722077.1 DUF3942 family protein [Bacillus cereus]MEB8858418.1 DUF3942 family protein [Bacillus cereus]MEB8986802.1 DUF3942 family protein [Bacillus cereus]
MSNLDQTIQKFKVYFGEDTEEKMLKEKFKEFESVFYKMHVELNATERGSFHTDWVMDTKFVEIEGVKLELHLNKETNVIEVSKKDESGSTRLDAIILKENELYCTKRGVIFTEDVFNEFLKEVFVEILG